MIETDRLTKRYGHVPAVEGIDLHVPRGQVVGLLGPNGAGKSTTIRMIVGYLMPTSGWVAVDGLEVSRNLIEVRKRIGYLPESAPLYSEMRVAEFLKFRAKMFGVPRARRKRAIDLAVHRCWLQDVRKRTISELSKGYRQRVGLAAALLHEPPLLILDEPTSGLDPDQIREVRTLLRELAGRHTIVLSTHILPEAEMTCDSIVMIARGKIRAQGTLQSLRQAAAKTMRYVIETDSSKGASVLTAVQGVADVEVGVIDSRWKRLMVRTKPDAGDLRE
ncbi:MAG TPA: ABC transporter ATP-binding protein, partial [Phycisphaerales bacterium]|nr:ABC transporter ATP-binding protein [Phycisphaerales bacterium]